MLGYGVLDPAKPLAENMLALGYNEEELVSGRGGDCIILARKVVFYSINMRFRDMHAAVQTTHI